MILHPLVTLWMQLPQGRERNNGYRTTVLLSQFGTKTNKSTLCVSLIVSAREGRDRVRQPLDRWHPKIQSLPDSHVMLFTVQQTQKKLDTQHVHMEIRGAGFTAPA